MAERVPAFQLSTEANSFVFPGAGSKSFVRTVLRVCTARLLAFCRAEVGKARYHDTAQEKTMMICNRARTRTAHINPGPRDRHRLFEPGTVLRLSGRPHTSESALDF